MKKILLVIGSVFAILILACGLLVWIGYRKYMTVEVVQYDPELKIVLGGGGNSIVLTSQDGARTIIVDTKMGAAARRLKREVTAGEVTIVNTHAHGDHTGGNGLYKKATIIAGAYTPEQWAQEAGKSRYPDATVKVGEERIIAMDTESVHIRNMGVAHTSNDVVVYLEKRKILATGDIIFAETHPALFTRSGCNVAAWVCVLDTLDKLYDVKRVVPGHGEMADKKALGAMKEYFVSVGEAIGNPVKLASLKQKYVDYASIPGMSGLERTAAFIAKERQQ